MINIPKDVKKILYMLENCGYEAYLVGGSVRDKIMGKPMGDIDIATSAYPEQVKLVFKDFKVFETGIKHGTVTVLVDGTIAEITTYRTENGYSDGRHPDSVLFTHSLKEDCARRDFTMNAVALGRDGSMIDYYGGTADIQSGIIRCVGEPHSRFREDALRILRAVRFASVLGFDIEKNTKQAVFDCKDLLKNISAERVYTELVKLLCGKNVKRVLLDYTEILAVFMPEIEALKGFEQNNHHHIYDVLEHTAVAVENTPPHRCLRMAALLHDFGKPHVYTEDESGTGHFYGHGEVSFEIAKNILRRLKVPNEDFEIITRLVRYHDTAIEHTEKAVRRALNKHGENGLKMLIELKRADNRGQNIKDFDRSEEYDRLRRLVKSVLEQQQCFSLKQLAVNGEDLKDAGIEPSVKMGKILDKLLEAVINGEAENKKAALLKMAAQIDAD